VKANDLLSIIESSDQKFYVPVDPNYGLSLSIKDQLIFDAVLELCERSELYAVEPVVFSEGAGIYKHGDLFFERRVVNLYDPPFQNDRKYEHYLQRVDADTAQKLQIEWRGSATQIVREFQDFEESARKAFPESFPSGANKSKED
tara:strand:+ start:423 stop:857 length:435 start_codon:yes stop_codon:yes gene_type:complete